MTNDAFAPLRSPRAATTGFGQQARAERARRRRFGARRAGAQPQIQGRWSLTAPLFAAGERRPGRPPPRAGRAAARALRHRHARARARRGDPRRVLLALRLARGAGDDRRLPARLLRRGPRRRAVRAPGRGRAAARAARRRRGAAGRARRHRPGAALRRGAEVAEARRAAPRPARPAPTSCSPARSPCSTSSAAARACRSSSPTDDERLTPAIEALTAAVERGRIRRLALERVDGEPVVGSAWEEPLLALGFRAGPRKLTIGA